MTLKIENSKKILINLIVKYKTVSEQYRTNGGRRKLTSEGSSSQFPVPRTIIEEANLIRSNPSMVFIIIYYFIILFYYFNYFCFFVFFYFFILLLLLFNIFIYYWYFSLFFLLWYLLLFIIILIIFVFLLFNI